MNKYLIISFLILLSLTKRVQFNPKEQLNSELMGECVYKECKDLADDCDNDNSCWLIIFRCLFGMNTNLNDEEQNEYIVNCTSDNKFAQNISQCIIKCEKEGDKKFNMVQLLDN